MKRMTAAQAVDSLNCCAYCQSELQLIWRTGSHEPVNEIMSLPHNPDATKARKLWNARPRNEKEWANLESDVRQIRISRGMPPRAKWSDFPR